MPTEAVESMKDIKRDCVEENEHEFGARAGERFQFASFLRKQKKEKKRKDSAEKKDTVKTIKDKEDRVLSESRDPFKSEERAVAAEETRETSQVISLSHSEQNQEEEEAPSRSNMAHKKEWIPAIFSSQTKEDAIGAVKLSTYERLQGKSLQVGAAEPQKYNEMAGNIACNGKPPPIRHSDFEKDTELLGGQRTMPGMVPNSLQNPVSWIRPEPKRLQDPNPSDPVLSEESSAQGQDESGGLEKKQRMNAVERDTLNPSESSELTDTSAGGDTEVIISGEDLIGPHVPSFLERAGTIGTKPMKSSKKADAVDSGRAPDHQDPVKAVNKKLSKKMFAESSVLAVLDDEDNMEMDEDKAAPVAFLVKQRKTSSGLNGLVRPVFPSQCRISESKRESFPSSKGRKMAYLENVSSWHREITVVSKYEGGISSPTKGSLVKIEAINTESIRLPGRNYSFPLQTSSDTPAHMKSQTPSSLLSAENETSESDEKAALTSKSESPDDTPSIPISLKPITASLKVLSKSMPVGNRVPTLSHRETLFEAKLGSSMCSVLNIDPTPEPTSLPSFAIPGHIPKEVDPTNVPLGEETQLYQAEEGLDSNQTAASLETNDHDGESQFLSLSERKVIFQAQLRASSSIFSRKEFATGGASSTSKNDEPVSGSSVPLQANANEMSRPSELHEEGADVQAPSLLERKRVSQAKLQSDEGEQAESRFLPLTDRKKIFQKNISSADISRKESRSEIPLAEHEHIDEAAKVVPSANYAQEILQEQQEDNPSTPGSEQAEIRAHRKIVRKTKIDGSAANASSRESQSKSKVITHREQFNNGTSALAIFHGYSEVDIAKVPSPTPTPTFTQGGSEIYSSKAPAPVPSGSVQAASKAGEPGIPFLTLAQRRSFFQSGSENMKLNLMPANGCDYKGASGEAKAPPLPCTMGPEGDLKNEVSKKATEALSTEDRVKGGFTSLSHRMDLFQSMCNKSSCTVFDADISKPTRSAKAAAYGSEETLSEINHQRTTKLSGAVSNFVGVKERSSTPIPETDKIGESHSRNFESPHIWRRSVYQTVGYHRELSSAEDLSAPISESDAPHVSSNEEDVPPVSTIYIDNEQIFKTESPDRPSMSEFHNLIPHGKKMLKQVSDIDFELNEGQHLPRKEEDGALLCIGHDPSLYEKRRSVFQSKSFSSPASTKGGNSEAKSSDPSRRNSLQRINPKHSAMKAAVDTTRAKATDGTRKRAAGLALPTKEDEMEEECRPRTPSYDSRRNFFETGGIRLSTHQRGVEKPTKPLPQIVLETRPKEGEEAPRNLTELNSKPEANMFEKRNDSSKPMPTEEQNASKRQDCPRRQPPSYYASRNFFESKSGATSLLNDSDSHPRLPVPRHHNDLEQCSKEGDENSLGLPVVADSPVKPHSSSERKVASPSMNTQIRSFDDPSSRWKPVHREKTDPVKPLFERRSVFKSQPDRAGSIMMLSVIQNPVSSKKTDLTMPLPKASLLLQPKNSLALDCNGDCDKLYSFKEMASTGKALTGSSYDHNEHTVLESSSSSSSGDEETHLGVPMPPHFPLSSFVSEPPSPHSAKASSLNIRRSFVSLRQTPRGSHRDLRCF